jgi:ATP-binding cassette subfamily B protein
MLWDLTRGQRRRFAASTAAMAVGILLLYLSPQIVRRAIDGIVAGHVVKWRLWGAAGLVVAVTALSGCFTYLKGRWAAFASETIARDLRDRLYDHLQHVPASYHDAAQTGDLVQRCTSDVETIRTFYSSQVVEIGRALLLLATALPVLLWMDWRMALVAVALMPVIFAFSAIYFGRVQGSFKATDEAEGRMTAVLQENLTGIRVVRAFARQEFEKTRFAGKNDDHRGLNFKLYVLMAVYWATSDLLVFLQTAAVLFVGAWRVSRGTMSVGTFVAFLQYETMLVWPVRQLGRILTEMGKAAVSLGRVQEILQQPRESQPAARDGIGGLDPLPRYSGGGLGWGSFGETAEPPPQPSPGLPGEGEMRLPQRVRGRIVLRDVVFHHGGKRVLDGISLTIAPGETLAVLGPSGSGKSTLVNLLLRLYDYDQGSITLDGVEINTLDRKYVRSQFAVVMQEPFLYSKTIRENIVLGRHTAADNEAIEAATAAAIHESIEEFDKKYDTLVGERGVTLSGGQRQRVAIARAVLRDAPVMVLDDALSAVDTRTEAAILAALRERRGRHTTILIAHRLSTLAQTDHVVVLEHGRITQYGTPDELLAEEGLYRRLWEIQGALEEDLKEEVAGTLRVPSLNGTRSVPAT